MTKSQQYFHDMMEYNKKVFEDFKVLHDKYEKDQKKFQDEFNEKGEEILRIIRKYENLLCSSSENSGFGKYSSNLADKFWELIRKTFPKIDFIGIK
ncbi:MAG TPA: hypothetical protein VF820_05415 [Patescibacteria group bacterium]